MLERYAGRLSSPSPSSCGRDAAVFRAGNATPCSGVVCVSDPLPRNVSPEVSIAAKERLRGVRRRASSSGEDAVRETRSGSRMKLALLAACTSDAGDQRGAPVASPPVRLVSLPLGLARAASAGSGA